MEWFWLTTLFLARSQSDTRSLSHLPFSSQLFLPPLLPCTPFPHLPCALFATAGRNSLSRLSHGRPTRPDRPCTNTVCQVFVSFRIQFAIPALFMMWVPFNIWGDRETLHFATSGWKLDEGSGFFARCGWRGVVLILQGFGGDEAKRSHAAVGIFGNTGVTTVGFEPTPLRTGD